MAKIVDGVIKAAFQAQATQRNWLPNWAQFSASELSELEQKQALLRLADDAASPTQFFTHMQEVAAEFVVAASEGTVDEKLEEVWHVVLTIQVPQQAALKEAATARLSEDPGIVTEARQLLKNIALQRISLLRQNSARRRRKNRSCWSFLLW